MFPGKSYAEKLKNSQKDPSNFFICDTDWPRCAFDFTRNQEYFKPFDEFVFRRATRTAEEEKEHII